MENHNPKSSIYPYPSYSETIHAKRLLKALTFAKQRGINYLNICPAAPRYSSGVRSAYMWGIKPFPCYICLDFIGIPYLDSISISAIPVTTICPCHAIGCEEAVARSWKALKAKGYME